MKYFRNIRADRRGGITAAAAVILCGIVVFNGVLYDYITFKMTESRAQLEIALACKSVLSSYDALLAEKYGLYGYNIGSGGSVSDEFGLYYKAEAYDVSLHDDFTNMEVLKKQIIGIMKLKTPVNLTQTILEASGVLSEACGKSGAYKTCAEAAQLLADMQKKQKELTVKTEGFFKGDPACVNGYSDYAVMDILRKMESADQNTFQSLTDSAIAVLRQYLEYNRQAALLCNELIVYKEQITAKMEMLRRKGPLSDDAQSIERQAAAMENKSAAEQLNSNISLLQERISLLEQFKSSGIADLQDIRAAFLDRNIESDIRIITVYAENGGAQIQDDRNQIQSQIMDRVKSLSGGVKDSYIIPPEVYAALPSQRQDGYTEKSLTANEGTFSFDTFDGFADLLTSASSLTDLLYSAGESLLIDDYVLSYMTARRTAPSADHLNNEIEYILSGSASSAENNKSAEHQILLLRFALNIVNILKDKERSLIAETMARGIAAALSMGAGVILYKMIIISAWALLDSYGDLEKLLSGAAVPLLALDSLQDGAVEKLQDYPFYLRLLLLFRSQQDKLLRTCDIIEINMREITGMNYRLSGVYHKITAVCKVRMEFISPLFMRIHEKYYRESTYEMSY